MSEFFKFASDSPFLTFFFAWLILANCVGYPLKIINRWIRHRNIAVAGWPPEHLDADGDPIKNSGEEK